MFRKCWDIFREIARLLLPEGYVSMLPLGTATLKNDDSKQEKNRAYLRLENISQIWTKSLQPPKKRLGKKMHIKFHKTYTLIH